MCRTPLLAPRMDVRRVQRESPAPTQGTDPQMHTGREMRLADAEGFRPPDSLGASAVVSSSSLQATCFLRTCGGIGWW